MAALRWEAVIGLEVHAQIRAASKIFSRAPVHFGAYANRLVAPLDAGLPGALPVLSRRAVEACVAAGLAVGGTLQAVSSFDRKHYFYQDMPLGYQITQQRVPLVRGGAIAIAVAAAEEAEKAVRINHIRIEQDSGKSIHDQHPTLTLVDFNRAGAGLMEIVSEPDLRSGEEAAAYLQKLAQLLTHVGACSIDEMDASTFRCDVNVSVRRVGAPLLGTRCEVKNLNKTKSVRRAIDYEIARQVGLLEAGGAVLQETRAFNARSGRTYTLRSKEDALDYRYSPEPDLPPLVLDPALVDAVRQQLPELPDARFARLRREYGLAPAVARMLVLSSPQCSLFEGAAGALGAGVAGVPSFARIAEIVTGELAGHLERASVPFSQCAVTAEQIASIVRASSQGTISARAGKQILMSMVDGSPKLADELAAELGLAVDNDRGRLIGFVETVLREHPSEADKYRAGRERVLAFLVGQVLKLSKGRASPELAAELLKEHLKR